jgi:hypothetical protein
VFGNKVACFPSANSNSGAPEMLSTLLLILTIWILFSLIIAFPLAKMMHVGSGEGPESLLRSDKDPAQEGRCHDEFLKLVIFEDRHSVEAGCELGGDRGGSEDFETGGVEEVLVGGGKRQE